MACRPRRRGGLLLARRAVFVVAWASRTTSFVPPASARGPVVGGPALRAIEDHHAEAWDACKAFNVGKWTGSTRSVGIDAVLRKATPDASVDGKSYQRETLLRSDAQTRHAVGFAERILWSDGVEERRAAGRDYAGDLDGSFSADAVDGVRNAPASLVVEAAFAIGDDEFFLHGVRRPCCLRTGRTVLPVAKESRPHVQSFPARSGACAWRVRTTCAGTCAA